MDTGVDNEVALDQITLPRGFLAALGEAASLQDVLDTAARWVSRMIEADRASVAVIDDDGNGLVVYALSGSEAIPVGETMPISGTIIGQVYRQRRAIAFGDDRGMEELDAQALLSAGLYSCLAAPMTSGGQCFGTVNVAHKELNRYSREDVRLLQSIAWLVAAFIRTQRHLADIRRLADIDPLTSLLNRQAFTSAGKQIWRDYAVNGQPFVLLLINVDRFKAINEIHGSDAGDVVLQSFAGQLSAVLRESDVVARVGGGEFAVVARGASLGDTEEWVEKLRSRIGRRILEYYGESLIYTSSIAVALPNEGDDGFAQVLARAGSAIAEAKKSGTEKLVRTWSDQ